MHFTMRSLLLITLLGLASCQFQYQNYNKFRPSPQESIGITQYNPNDYIINLKAPTFQTRPNQNYYPPARPPFQGYPYPGPLYPGPLVPPSKPLFTPAQIPFPAESSGQLDNFNKALQEEQALKGQTQFFNNGFSGSGGFGKSYVDVKFGGPNNLQYHYTV